jgi:hypothetical protein
MTMTPETYDHEAVYDAEIAPLMTQIIAIAQRMKLRQQYTHDHPPAWWTIMWRGEFQFDWFPGVGLGVYRVWYDGWHLAINLGVFSLSWYY